MDESKAVYVHFYSFNRQFNGLNNPPKENLEFLVEFMRSKQMVAFNKAYESGVCALKASARTNKDGVS